MSDHITLPEFKKLQKWNVFLGVAHSAAAIGLMSYVLATNDSGILTNIYEIISNPLSSQQFELEQDGQIRLEWLVVAFFAVTAAAHFFYASNFKDLYYNQLKSGTNGFRWIEYAISATLMVIVVATLSGIRDTQSLALIASANVAIMLQGFVLERLLASNAETVDYVVPFATAWGLLAIIWIFIIISFAKRISEAKEAGINVPGFVYGVIIPTFLFFTSFGVVNLVQIIKEKKRKDGKYRYEPYEFTYVLLSLFSKLLFGIFIVIGIVQSQSNQISSSSN